MLGFGRALGETMAVTMVIGNNPQVSWSLFAPQYTMAAVIANEFTEAADELTCTRSSRSAWCCSSSRSSSTSLSRLLIWRMTRERRPRAARRGRRRRRRRHDAAIDRRRIVSAVMIGALRRCPCCSRWCPLAFILFFVVTQGIAVARTWTSSPRCRSRSASRRRHGQRHRRHADALSGSARCSPSRSAS